MTVRAESLAAYDTVDLTARQTDVLAAIAALHAAGRRPADADIAAHLGWTINRVTPRRGELVDLGRVTLAGRKLNAGGNRVRVWMPVPEQLRFALA
jgi:hypothetical protein